MPACISDLICVSYNVQSLACDVQIFKGVMCVSTVCTFDSLLWSDRVAAVLHLHSLALSALAWLSDTSCRSLGHWKVHVRPRSAVLLCHDA